MSLTKTKVEKEAVDDFLKIHFGEQVSNIETIQGGELSQAFSFRIQDEEYVIRINANPEGFQKDVYAFKHFSSAKLPIPEITEIGKLNDTQYFAISKKASGTVLDKLSKQEYEAAIPSLLDILDVIHAIDVYKQGKFGGWNSDGAAYFSSWKEHLLSTAGKEKRAEFEKLCKESYLERNVVDTLLAKIEELVPYCPEEIHLLHGDYGFSNVVVERGKVTGVLDWANSKYGDFLYDVAWLSLWPPIYDFAGMSKKRFIDKGMNVEYYEERILCYLVFSSLESLNFTAKGGEARKDDYEWTRDRILSLIR
jgi:hygromycin-B 4-O-kinase